jgi:hypothetical protein
MRRASVARDGGVRRRARRLRAAPPAGRLAPSSFALDAYVGYTPEKI